MVGTFCFERERIELWEKEMACEFGFNYLSTKFEWKFQLKKNNLRFTMTVYHLNFESISELKNLETEFSLKRFLKKKTIYGGNDLYWKLTSPTPTNVKSISSHCRQFQLTIFLHQTTFSDRHFS